MKRLSVSTPRWLAFALLLAFVTLAGSESFLHTCHPQDDDQGTCDHQGMAPQSLDPTLNLPGLDTALTAEHHHDCLACQWATNTRQPAALSTGVSTLTPDASDILLTQIPHYATSIYTPSGIRGPPQA
jgi:hypothetical protein